MSEQSADIPVAEHVSAANEAQSTLSIQEQEQQMGDDFEAATNLTTGILFDVYTDPTTSEETLNSLKPTIDTLTDVENAYKAGGYDEETKDWVLKDNEGNVLRSGNYQEVYPGVVDSLLALTHNPKAQEIGQRLARQARVVVTTKQEDGTEKQMPYLYEDWVKEGRPRGEGIRGKFVVVDPSLASSETPPEKTEENDTSSEEEDPKEVRKNEIVTEMREYVTSLSKILQMHYKNEQFYGTPAQQARIVSQIERFYPELAVGEVTDEQLLEMRMRDNRRELYINAQMEKDDDISEELKEALMGDKGFLEGENELLESLGVVSGMNTRDESLELQALFEKKEQGYMFRQMRQFVDTHGVEIQQKLEAVGKLEKNKKMREKLVNSGVATAFIIWLIASQMLSGEGDERQS
ncbi:MAG: hypothetical protein NUV98_06790 [Candidatus Roizmanbacteria bacterium]|nr:hypothetical protein [Candidatus Roizmanbacteria bacterium]